MKQKQALTPSTAVLYRRKLPTFPFSLSYRKTKTLAYYLLDFFKSFLLPLRFHHEDLPLLLRRACLSILPDCVHLFTIKTLTSWASSNKNSRAPSSS